MKKFILKIFILTLSVILSLSIIEYYIRTIPNDYSYKVDYINKNASRIEILVLGNSQTYYGVYPLYFRHNCFNMALNGQGLALDEFVVNKYLGKLTALKCIIIPLGYQSFIASEIYTDFGPTYYQIYYDYKKNPFSTDYYEFLAHGIEKIAKHLSGKSVVNAEPTGEFRYDASEDYIDDAEYTANYYSQIAFDMKNKDRLEHIVAECEKRKVDVILVKLPVIADYQLFQDKSRLKMIDSVAENLTTKYDNAYFFDYYGDTICSDTTYFKDCAHLNEIGAEIFSENLASKVDSLLDR